MRLAAWERQMAAAMRARDPVAAVRALYPGADADGVRLTALLVARLRFERLLRGSPEAEAWFDRDPADFACTFGRYHAEAAPRAFFPADEAALFGRWCKSVLGCAADGTREKERHRISTLARGGVGGLDPPARRDPAARHRLPALPQRNRR